MKDSKLYDERAIRALHWTGGEVMAFLIVAMITAWGDGTFPWWGYVVAMVASIMIGIALAIYYAVQSSKAERREV